MCFAKCGPRGHSAPRRNVRAAASWTCWKSKLFNTVDGTGGGRSRFFLPLHGKVPPACHAGLNARGSKDTRRIARCVGFRIREFRIGDLLDSIKDWLSRRWPGFLAIKARRLFRVCASNDPCQAFGLTQSQNSQNTPFTCIRATNYSPSSCVSLSRRLRSFQVFV